MPDKEKILIVDDDVFVCQGLAAILEEEGYTVITAQDGKQSLRHLYAERPDLAIIDIVMPGMDGWELCGRIRDLTDIPILILTGQGQVTDRVKGLDLGADDYLVKPVAAEELQARVRAALRRARQISADAESQALSFDGGRLLVDTETQEVQVEGEALQLRPLEHRLLIYFVRNAGHILEHDQILAAVWGHEYKGDRASLKLYVWRLRRKIERDPAQPCCILTKRGIGYRFVRPDRE
jgi:two-component system KDP operon response regulator KdpE